MLRRGWKTAPIAEDRSGSSHVARNLTPKTAQTFHRETAMGDVCGFGVESEAAPRPTVGRGDSGPCCIGFASGR
jgi:hypothetical protein